MFKNKLFIKLMLQFVVALAFIGASHVLFEVTTLLTDKEPITKIPTYIFALGLMFSPLIKGSPQYKWYDRIAEKLLDL